MSKLKSLKEFKSENKLNSNELSQFFYGHSHAVATRLHYHAKYF